MRNTKVPIFSTMAIAIALLCRQFYLNANIDIFIEEPSGSLSIVKMSRKDANDLDWFFREIMIPDALAYTLVGVKPLSFTCYRQPSYPFLSLMPSNLKILRGWKIWEKYKHHFQTNRIMFWKEESPWVEGVTCLILADMERCNRSIEQNSKDFQKILGQQTSDLFKDVGRIPFFRDTLQMHDVLIGILLGFGRGNAWLYHQNTWMAESSSKLPRIGNSILEQESSNYGWKYCTLQTIDMSDLKLPQFVGDPDSEESKQLMNKYLLAREEIRNFYKNKNFLSATLSLYKYGSILLKKSPEWENSTASVGFSSR